MSPEIRKLLDNVDNFDSIIGKQFHNFEAYSTSGKLYSQENFLGKVTLVNFWFEACPSCHLFFTKLNDLQTNFKSDSSFQLISITFDKMVEATKNSIKWNLQYPIISIGKDSCTKLNFEKSYPINFIINRKGAIVFAHSGSGKYGTDAFANEIIPFIKNELLNN